MPVSIVNVIIISFAFDVCNELKNINAILAQLNFIMHDLYMCHAVLPHTVHYF